MSPFLGAIKRIFGCTFSSFMLMFSSLFESFQISSYGTMLVPAKNFLSSFGHVYKKDKYPVKILEIIDSRSEFLGS